jgi:bla regulator protein blaR1
MRLHKNLPLSLPYVAVLAAQTGDPDWQKAAGGKMAFEVASVKPAKLPRLPNLPLDLGDAKPAGGRFAASFSLSTYIGFAYKLDVFQLKEMNAQLPKWASDDYAIDAEAAGNPTKDQMRLMMQSLLADRFKLRCHFKTEAGPVLALTLVKPGKLGPKLRPHSEGPPCPDSFEADIPFTPIAPPKPGVVWPPQCGTSAQTNGTWIGSRNTTMGVLAHDISAYGYLFGEVDKTVVDRTGLQGRFDFILDFPSGVPSLFPKPPPNPDDSSPDPKGPLFLNALREQLGLKVVRSKGTIWKFVIDHVEPPSGN